MLTNDQIAYIIKDLNQRGVVLEGFQDELIDHVCSAVENELEKPQTSSKNFVETYHEVIKTFGYTPGLRETQYKTILSKNSKPVYMFRNYLSITFRNLRKHSVYSFINILGLAIGIASCLVIFLYIQEELSYDSYNTKADRIYRVEADVNFGGNQFKMTYRSAPEALALLNDYPEVESTVRFLNYSPYLVRSSDSTENMKEHKVIWADSTFFKVFSVNVLEGDPNTALKQHNGAAISKKMAEKYFHNVSAMGKTIILDNNYHFTVTAVYEDIPAASHFHFDIIVSFVSDYPPAREARSTSFMSENFNTYLLLKEGTDAKLLQSKLPGFIDKHMGPHVAKIFGNGFSMEKFRASGNKYDLTLRPLTDIHLHSDIRGEFESNSSITYVYLLGLVGAFILVIGCINFMNLSTARSSNRAKEVGVRKVMGSLRSHLVRQFLTESTMVTAVSFFIALGLAYMFMPVFNNLSQKTLQIPFGNPLFYLALVAAGLLIGVMAGLYPSFFLSAFKPAQVLKGNLSSGMKSGFIRSMLVVFQFVISIFLIVGAISINQQLSFIQSKRLGFDKDQVIIIHDAYALRPNRVRPFKEAVVMKLNSVETGTISAYVPVANEYYPRSNNTIWNATEQPAAENLISTQLWGADYDYIKTYKMNVVQGRDFSIKFPSDSSGVILNQTAIKRLGIEGDPVGKQISTFEGDADPNNIRNWTIIGVIEDFHFSSMKESILPLGLYLRENDGSVSFRFHAENTSEVIRGVEKEWKALAPGEPFQYSFLDEDFSKMYYAEQRLGTVFSIFAGLAIIIACLGLFALTSFAAEQRTKEIGIRKVLGASINSIVILLSREFGKLILIAFLIAAPLAWFGIDWWLNGYSYKTEIGWTIYVLTGSIVLVIALVTMSFQSIRAATANPVNSLRSE